MDTQIVNYIAQAVLFLVLAVFAIASLMAIYVLIRYGRTRSITVATSIAFAALFGLGALAAFLRLQSIF